MNFERLMELDKSGQAEDAIREWQPLYINVSGSRYLWEFNCREVAVEVNRRSECVLMGSDRSGVWRRNS